MIVLTILFFLALAAAPVLVPASLSVWLLRRTASKGSFSRDVGWGAAISTVGVLWYLFVVLTQSRGGSGGGIGGEAIAIMSAIRGLIVAFELLVFGTALVATCRWIHSRVDSTKRPT